MPKFFATGLNLKIVYCPNTWGSPALKMGITEISTKTVNIMFIFRSVKSISTITLGLLHRHFWTNKITPPEFFRIYRNVDLIYTIYIFYI